MLKMTKIELKLISNIGMYVFVEKGMRGGISYIAKRFSKTNNKYMKSYDDSKSSKYIMYLGANNLYGWSMSQYLLYGKFKWLNQKQIDKFDVHLIGENSLDGYILQVDLEYPNELYELHNDYPLASEKLKISHNILSKYCSSIAIKYDIKIGSVNKLVSNLGNKSNHVLHYKILQLYLPLGMKLVSIHRILKFKQSDWLKKYIDFNTDKRKNAVNNFEKDFFKLMNNSFYGKTMENLGKRVKVTLVNNAKDYKKYVSKPSFFSQKIFSKNFVAIHEIKPVLTLDTPIHVEFSILDLSKLLMYEFHYKYIGPKYDNSAKLLYTNTDSLVY